VIPNLIIHGGTSMEADPKETIKVSFLERIAEQGHASLRKGQSANECVVASIKALEDSGYYIAGAGSEPQLDGIVRTDAAIMSSDGKAGAVNSIAGIKNPIMAAAKVQQSLIHSNLTGEIASNILLDQFGLEPSEKLSTNLISQNELGARVRASMNSPDGMFGTVGIAALDSNGLLSAGTSTGGYDRAIPGRVGDSGALSVGTLATKRCAVSCTGDGDRILKTGVATVLDALLKQGKSLQDSIQVAKERLAEFSAMGAFVVLTENGEVGKFSNLPVFRVALGIPNAAT
jgi:isoaspartyl peptidase/L-asparaginase-like protein (Ntn-hydrolase superfamily)